MFLNSLENKQMSLGVLVEHLHHTPDRNRLFSIYYWLACLAVQHKATVKQILHLDLQLCYVKYAR